MYVGRDFDIANTGESEVFGLDFVNDLASGDSLSTVTFAMTVYSGTDASPSSHLIGGGGIVGTIALQRVSGLLAGVTYVLTCTATTALGNSLVLYSRIPCRAVL